MKNEELHSWESKVLPNLDVVVPKNTICYYRCIYECYCVNVENVAFTTGILIMFVLYKETFLKGLSYITIPLIFTVLCNTNFFTKNL